MRLRVVLLLAAREVRASVRSRWFVSAAAGFLALSLGVSALGLAGAQRSGFAGFDRTAASLLSLVVLFVPLVGLALGSLSLAGDLEDGALAMLLAQPLTRAEVLLAKFAGLFASLAGAILVGFGGAGVVLAIGPGGDPSAFVALAATTVLLAGASLAIGLALSALLASRAKAIGGAFAAWLTLVYLSDLASIGISIARELPPSKVFLLGVLNPVQAARVLGMLSLAGRLDELGPAGIFGVETFGRAGLGVFLCSSLACAAVVPLVIAYRSFRTEVIP